MTSTDYNLRLNEINTEESHIDNNVLSWASQDWAYGQVVSKRISLEDFEGAIQTASKMNTWANQDGAFFDIVYKSNNPNIAEKAADKMNTWANQDQAYLHITRKRVGSGEIKTAIQTASKINTWANQDHAFFEILEKCNDVEDMELIASKTNTWANQDCIYQKIVAKRLSDGDVEGAARTANKMNTWANQDGAIFDIFRQIQDLKKAESVVEKMNSNSNIKTAYQILIDKHNLNGNLDEVSRIREKIIKLEEREKEAVAAVAAVALIALSSMIIIPMLVIVSAATFTLISTVK